MARQKTLVECRRGIAPLTAVVLDMQFLEAEISKTDLTAQAFSCLSALVVSVLHLICICRAADLNVS